MITYPLNNIQYTAEDAELYNSTRTSGVFADDSFNYSVTGADNTIVIGTGVAWIKNGEFSGKVVAQKEALSLNLGLPNANYPRIDAVVIQFNANSNSAEIIVKNGTASSSPSAPAVVRTESVYELHLYHIHRGAGELSISSANITDLRTNSAYCGIMIDAVTKIDNTLTKIGYVADAKAVGDAVSRLSADKAPAGFGLGTDAPAVLHTLAEVNNYKKSGWATATLTSGHIMGFPNALIRVDAGANYIVQTAYVYFKYYGGFFELKRITNDSGDWQPWEWVNPDFRAGTEYRTTERFNGKPVYVKTIEIGSLPVGEGVANRINFYPDLSDIDKLVRWDGMVTNGKASYTLPVTGGNNLGNMITAYYHGGAVYLETNGDYSAYTGTATFWWTKTTD